MIDAVALPEAALLMIDDPEMRTLFQGIKSAAATPLIRDAFQIVYEDLAPVRFAGDIIFKQLSKSAQSASKDSAMLAEALPPTQLETMRRLFDLIDADSSGALDRDELLESGLLSTLNLVGEGATEEEAVDEFMDATDTDKNGNLSFVEFAAAAAKEPKLQDADDVLLELMEYYTLESSKGLAEDSVATRRRKRKDPGEKFDFMLATFRDWQDKPKLVASVDASTRLGQVLMGCFAGTGNTNLVEALRLVYVKYAPLRVGGDMIFKLVQRVVKDYV